MHDTEPVHPPTEQVDSPEGGAEHIHPHPRLPEGGAEHIHPHSHPHPHEHPHTHLRVDYSFLPGAGEYKPPFTDEQGYTWWKGNLHTHTFWSDGDQFPEVVAQWYHAHGYHFLALSDHNVLSRGERWMNIETSGFVRRGGGAERVMNVYRERFSDDWIETRVNEEGQTEVRLKPLNEVRALFEQAGRFLMVEAEEITEGPHVIHVNATNIAELILPQTGATVEETIRLNVDAVVEQARETGQDMIPHLNHPNFRNAVTAEDMAPVENLRLFEVYNGHRGVQNFGADDGVKHLDRVWDIILTLRLGELGLGPVYGLATDDAHHYDTSTSDVARPGRGWVMVRSRYLTPEHLVRALRAGDFYSSNGVTLSSVRSDGQRYTVEVDAEPGVEYTVRFIGTREGYDASRRPFRDEDGRVRQNRTMIYSDDVGQVLAEVQGSEASYTFTGDELYVRALVISSRAKENYFAEGEMEMAWTQPVIPGEVR